jgi:hypothetical protein
MVLLGNAIERFEAVWLPSIGSVVRTTSREPRILAEGTKASKYLFQNVDRSKAELQLKVAVVIMIRQDKRAAVLNDPVGA